MDKRPADPARILFLFSDTGGGHRSAAEAIIEAIQLEYPGAVACEMVDFFKDYTPPPINLAPRIYPPLVRLRAMWIATYRFSDGRRRARLIFASLWPYVRSGLHRLIDEHPSDLIVSVHQVPNIPVSSLAAARSIPFVTVVTDLVSTHAAWYAPRATHVIVPTEAAFQRGLKNRLQPGQMSVVGMPVAERFAHPPGDRSEIRARLGWPADLPLILLVGGGEGVGPLEAMARTLDAARLPAAQVVVTGRNRALRERLERIPWQIPTFIYGFVTEMPQFMQAADILVTKAGPGSISEGFIAGLPIVLYSKIPGTEDGNVAYVTGAGAGVWAPEAGQMLAAVSRWLARPDERAETARRSLALAHPEASRRIARILMSKI